MCFSVGVRALAQSKLAAEVGWRGSQRARRARVGRAWV
jgi:hypothetical protein